MFKKIDNSQDEVLNGNPKLPIAVFWNKCIIIHQLKQNSVENGL